MIGTRAKQLTKNIVHSLELLPYLFAPSPSAADGLVIVTGADSSHFKSLRQFLASLFAYEPGIRAIAFDLGLSSAEVASLQNNFQDLEIRRFPFEDYPEYFDIRINAGQYAWKPVIVGNLLEEFHGCVCWMDAGNVVTSPLSWLRRITSKHGLYSPWSLGCIADWTHPGTLAALEVPPKMLTRPNLNGACVAVCYENLTARELILRWRACALDKNCIAPPGSSRDNHRQDQALLSVLAHLSGIAQRMPSGFYGFKVHQDVD